MKMGR